MLLHVDLCKGKALLCPNPHDQMTIVRDTEDKDGTQDSVNK